MDDELAREAAALRLAVFRFSRRLRGERVLDTMSDARFAVLATLAAFGDQTLGGLAMRERVSPPSMNRIVNSLESSGFVTRIVDDADRRRVIIALTAAGVDLVDETARRRDEWLVSVLEGLDEDERAAFATAARVMKQAAAR